MLYFRKNIEKILLSFLLFLTTSVVLAFPLSNRPDLWIFNYLRNNAVGEMQNITAFAFNFWWVLFKPFIELGKPYNNFDFSEVRLLHSPLSQEGFLHISLSLWAFLLFGLFTLPLMYIVIKNKKDFFSKNIFLLFSMVTVVGFIFMPRMHERYMYPLFPLLATYIGITTKYKKFYIVFSIFNLVNLYMVWHPMLPPLIPYLLMTNINFQWLIALLTVVTFLIFYVSSFKNLLRNEKL